MISIDLIGIGTGNPDHLTRAAEKAMNMADMILLPRKGDAKSDLVDLRRAICAQLLTRDVKIVEFNMPRRTDRSDYVGAVLDWHDAIAGLWMEQIALHLPDGGRLALLVWGDPSLYDSSLRIAARLPGATVRVIPGITSIQALTAAHGICLNDLAQPVLVTTGRRLGQQGWPACADTLVVMLDGHCAFQTLLPGDFDIWWGAYLGLPQERLIHGPLAIKGDEIISCRAELRRQHGWIMDIYLLRRRRPDRSA